MSGSKGFTLEGIIECLVDRNRDIDSKLLNIFLYTYRNYCQPRDIIRLIHNRLIYLSERECDLPELKGFIKSIIVFFNIWLTAPFSYDFHQLPNFPALNDLLLNIREWPQIISFISSSNELKDSFKRLEDKISKVLIGFNAVNSGDKSNFRELPVDCQFRDSFVLNSSLTSEMNKNLFDFSPETIAISLSFLDQKVLRDLRLPELVKHSQKQNAPSVAAVIENYNQLHNVVKLTVKQPILAKKRFDQYLYSGRNSPIFPDSNLTKESRSVFSSPGIKLHERNQVIEKWIHVAQVLHNFRNFSSLVAILTALNSPELKSYINFMKIKKPTKTFELYLSLLKVIEPYINQNKEEVLNGNGVSVASSAFNLNFFSKQKSKIKNPRHYSTEIPYLGIYLRNMTYINEGFPDYIESPPNHNGHKDKRLINIDKCRRQFDVMAQVRLMISSLNFSDIKEDEGFSSWYFCLQVEVKKSKKYTSDASLSNPNSSLESLRSITSLDSSVRTDCSTPSFPKSYSKPFIYKSQECLRSSLGVSSQQALSRNRSVDANLFVHSNDPKVATVKLNTSRCKPPKTTIPHKSDSFSEIQIAKPWRRHETISAGTTRFSDRPLLRNIVRSPSSYDKKDDRSSIILETILYKKIQIYENDRTTDFIERVLKKFGKSNLAPNDYDVVQILEDGREIIITFRANLFYALAKKSEYLIEVRPRKLVT